MPCHTYCDCKFDGSSKLQWKRWREGFSFFSIVISLVLGRFGSHAYVQKRRVLGLGNTEECPFTSVVLHISKKGLPPHTFSQTPLRLYYTMPIDCPHFDIDVWRVWWLMMKWETRTRIVANPSISKWGQSIGMV